MEETKKPATDVEGWGGAAKLVADTVKENRALASEVLQSARRESKAKNIAIICMAIALIAIPAIMSITYYRNDERWRDFLSEYDIITQDGEGVNYYNSEIGGNVTYGTENNEEKESQ